MYTCTKLRVKERETVRKVCEGRGCGDDAKWLVRADYIASHPMSSFLRGLGHPYTCGPRIDLPKKKFFQKKSKKKIKIFF